jgi:23S rRNA pseudouridine1911/1915/1917 synthase
MKQRFRYSVGAEAEGERLDVYLSARLFRLSRMRIAELLARGAGEVDGATALAGFKLRAGQAVEIELDVESPGSMTPEPLPLEIIYEDAELLVVSKPSGMLVHPTRGVKTGTLANALAYHLNRLRIEEGGFRIEEKQPGLLKEQGDTSPQPERLDSSSLNPQSAIQNPQPFVRPGLAHRLDRATSGLMVVAKTQRALSQLSQHFHRRLIEKRYLAVVHGSVEADAVTIDAPIGHEPEAQPKWSAMEGGKPAETRLRVLERRGGLTLVELEPVTGRTNQLRIHCSHIGHPVVGDEWYAPPGFPRLCLHAAKLAFHHPSSNEWMQFNSTLPAVIAEAFESGLDSTRSAHNEARRTLSRNC